MSDTQTLGPCCVSGHVHSGETRGTESKYGDYDVYVTGDEANKGKTVLIISDIFGWKMPNTRLVADEIAAAGFYVVLPDFLKGDFVPHELLPAIAPLQSAPQRSALQVAADTAKVGTSLGPWAIKHREAVTRPLIETFVAELKKGSYGSGFGKLGALGHCFGGRYSILLAHGEVDAGVAMHPSFLGVPADIEPVTKPISIAVGDSDNMFSPDDQEKTKNILHDKRTIPYEFKTYPGQVHGFSVRADLNNESERHAKEEATKQTINWFKMHLN